LARYPWRLLDFAWDKLHRRKWGQNRRSPKVRARKTHGARLGADIPGNARCCVFFLFSTAIPDAAERKKPSGSAGGLFERRLKPTYFNREDLMKHFASQQVLSVE